MASDSVWICLWYSSSPRQLGHSL